MIELRPLNAIRYDFDLQGGDLSDVLAPPYDVLSEGDKRRLLAKSDRNIVSIDLPHLPPKSAGSPAAYDRAASTLEDWLNDGTLIHEPQPALYVYHQAFEHEGKRFIRRMFLARLRLEPFERGVILPHEQTFGGPKEDRMALMKATRCQLSPIFGLYADPDDRIGHIFSDIVAHPPRATGTLSGVENRIWVVTDKVVIDQVASTMAAKKVYIADGHHRYGTALMYRDWRAERQGEAINPNDPANFVMFVLASMDDPGCLILPYCRAIGQTTVSTLLDAWKAGVEVLPEGDPASDLTLHDGETDQHVPVRFTRREALRDLEPDQVDPWYALDYAYLHRFLIDTLLARRTDATPDVHYVKSSDDAIAAAKAHNGVALLTKATPMEHLRAMSEAGGLMPQKSTYFHPKLATGIAINPLA